MKTGRGQKRGRGASGADTSGRIGEESDPDYSSADEKGSEGSGSESSAEEEVSSSSSGNEHKGEMRSKRMNDERCEGKHDGRVGVMEKRGLRGRGKEEVDQKKGLQGKGKGKGKGKVDQRKRGSKNDEGEDGGREQWVEVDIRHRCALDVICALNDQLSDVPKESVRGMVWSLMLECKSFLMDRHLVQALLQSWKPEEKCFKLGRRNVPFSQFDVALLTGLPATGKRVTFEISEGGSEVEEVLKGAMEERVDRKKQRRRTSQKDVRIYRNYVLVLLELCKVTNTVETGLLFKKLYTLLVVSGLLFPRSTGGVAWELVHIIEDVDGAGEYNWSEAVWEFLVQAMEDGQEKMRSMKNLQINGFAMILQVWFYEYNNIYAFADEKRVPRLSSWVNLYKGKKYDAGVVVRALKDSEVR